MKEGHDPAGPSSRPTRLPCAVLLQPNENACLVSLLLYLSIRLGAGQGHPLHGALECGRLAVVLVRLLLLGQLLCCQLRCWNPFTRRKSLKRSVVHGVYVSAGGRHYDKGCEE